MYPLGFSDAQLTTFAKDYHLPVIAERLPMRGDANRLRTIAWWGSALADVAAAGHPADRSEVLKEGAAFNLAVALFDSAMDGAATLAAQLAEALEPQRTRARLFVPSSTQTRLCCRDPSLNLVANLFDAALSSVGRRLASRQADLVRLSEQLAGMYQSEMGLSPDPFIAKTGPVVFIGELAGGIDVEPVRRLFHALAHFCQLWDDWQDLEEDLRRLEPNTFLGAPRPIQTVRRVAFSVKGLTRVLGGDLLHRGIAQSLVAGLRGTLKAARECDTDTYARTLALCRELVR